MRLRARMRRQVRLYVSAVGADVHVGVALGAGADVALGAGADVAPGADADVAPGAGADVAPG